jgi:hypothetical protein
MRYVLPGTFLILLTLKLLEMISVSWWVVFAPLIVQSIMFLIFTALLTFLMWLDR